MLCSEGIGEKEIALCLIRPAAILAGSQVGNEDQAPAEDKRSGYD